MNSDIDYPVAPAFGENNARYNERRARVKHLIIKESILFSKRGLAREELELLARCFDAIANWDIFIKENGANPGAAAAAMAGYWSLVDRKEFLMKKISETDNMLGNIRKEIGYLGG